MTEKRARASVSSSGSHSGGFPSGLPACRRHQVINPSPATLVLSLPSIPFSSFDDSHFLLPSPPSRGFRRLCELVKPFSVMRPSAGLIFRGGGGVLILAHYPSLRECDSAVNDGEQWLRRWCIVWGS